MKESTQKQNLSNIQYQRIQKIRAVMSIYLIHKNRDIQRHNSKQTMVNTRQNQNSLRTASKLCIKNPQDSQKNQSKQSRSPNKLLRSFNPFNRFYKEKSKLRQIQSKANKVNQQTKIADISLQIDQLSFDFRQKSKIQKSLQAIKNKQKRYYANSSSQFTNSFCQSASIYAGKLNEGRRLNETKVLFNFVQNGIKSNIRKKRSKTQPTAEAADNVMFSIKKLQFNNVLKSQSMEIQPNNHLLTTYKFYSRIKQPRDSTDNYPRQSKRELSKNAWKSRPVKNSKQTRKQQQKRKCFNFSPWDLKQQDL